MRFTEQAHVHGYQALLHSCGAIHKVIDRLIDAGVDCLHPLQALAANMNAETLARDFNGRIAFMGGIDTQQLLVNGTPHELNLVRSRSATAAIGLTRHTHKILQVASHSARNLKIDVLGTRRVAPEK